LFLEDWRDARRAEEAVSKRGERKSKKRGSKIKGKGSKIQIFCFRQSRLFNGLGQGIQQPRGPCATIEQQVGVAKALRADASLSARISARILDSRHPSTDF
jgi:hypothetical protein